MKILTFVKLQGNKETVVKRELGRVSIPREFTYNCVIVTAFT